MKMWLRREDFNPCRRMESCAPSPQSTIMSEPR